MRIYSVVIFVMKLSNCLLLRCSHQHIPSPHQNHILLASFDFCILYHNRYLVKHPFLYDNDIMSDIGKYDFLLQVDVENQLTKADYDEITKTWDSIRSRDIPPYLFIATHADKISEWTRDWLRKDVCDMLIFPSRGSLVKTLERLRAYAKHTLGILLSATQQPTMADSWKVCVASLCDHSNVHSRSLHL